MLRLIVLLPLAVSLAVVAATDEECARSRKRPAEYWERKWPFLPSNLGAIFYTIYTHKNSTSDLPSTFPEGTSRRIGMQNYCIVKSGDPVMFHRIRSDDIYHWYYGNTLELYIIDQHTGNLTVHDMGIRSGNFIVPIMAGDYFAGKVKYDKPHRYALVGASVFPGFDFPDLFVPNQAEMLAMFPQHADVIAELAVETPYVQPEIDLFENAK